MTGQGRQCRVDPCLISSWMFKAAVLLLGCTTTRASVITDAAATTASGSGLASLQTVGIATAFTITSRDQSGVAQTSGGDRFLVEVIGNSHIITQPIDELDGTYSATYTLTRSGNYNIEVNLFSEGGLAAEYYENVWFFYSPVERRVDSRVDFDWASGRVTPQATDFVSVRWKGKVKADVTDTMTFHARADESVRLFVGGEKLVDCWEKNSCKPVPSSGTPMRGGSGTLRMIGGQLYDITVEYRENDGPAAVQLLWSSKGMVGEHIVGERNLLYSMPISAASRRIEALPGLSSGPASHAAGPGLTLLTAGIEGKFQVSVRDQYGNRQESLSQGSELSVRVYGGGGRRGGTGCSSGGCGGRPRAEHGRVVEVGDGGFEVTTRSEIAGDGEVLVEVLQRGGLSATYYGGELERGLATVGGVGVGWAAARVNGGVEGLGANETAGVRWRGLVGARGGGETLFAFGAVAQGERVRLWIDNTLVIDQWSSLESQTASGTIALPRGAFYEVWAEYKTLTSDVNSSLPFTWQEQGAAAVPLPSELLFAASPVRGSPFALAVQPAAVCASQSFVSPSDLPQHALREATAGRQASFAITARDAFANAVASVGPADALRRGMEVRLTGVGSGRGSVVATGGGVLVATYTATRSGAYAVAVTFDGERISGSPFALRAVHGLRHVPSSGAQGGGLTVATAGEGAAFTILVRDRHGNPCFDPRVQDAGLLLRLTTSLGEELHQPLSLFRPLYLPPAADEDGVEDARVAVRYEVTAAGEYSLRVVAGAGLHGGELGGGPWSLSVQPQAPCASASSAELSRLSLLTAGAPARFRILSRDAYANPVDPSSQPPPAVRVFTVRSRQQHHAGPTLSQSAGTCFGSGSPLVDGRDRLGSIEGLGGGNLQGAVTPTQGGDNCLLVTLGSPGGLQATYYLNDAGFGAASASERVAVQEAGIDFSVSSSGGELAGSRIAAPGVFSARWSGQVLPSQTGEYTFYLGSDGGSSGGGGERVKLWVDNSLVVDQWSSLEAGGGAPSGTISLLGGALYDIMAEARGNASSGPGNGSFVQLKWTGSASNTTELVPSTRLYQSTNIASSPHPIMVSAGAICAASSSIFGAAVTIATAGFPSTFTLQARDDYGNERSEDLEAGYRIEPSIASSLSLRALPSLSQDSLGDEAVVETVGSAAFASGGRFGLAITPTSSGRKFLRGRLLAPGGLYGTYFENADFSDHSIAPNGAVATDSFERVDPSIDFLWEVDARPIGSPLTAGKDVGPAYFSVRWRGLIKPNVSEVHTFFVSSGGGQVKLFVDDLMILTSQSAIVEEPAGTIALMAGVLYPITLEFKRTRPANPAKRLRLSWRAREVERALVPSGRLFAWTTSRALSSSGLPVFVNPGPTCAATSTVTSLSSTATVGVPLTFTVQSRDAFGNLASGAADGLPPKHWTKGKLLNTGYLASAASASEVTLALSAPTTEGAFLGKRIYLHSTGEDREITGYSAGRAATLAPPLHALPGFPDSDLYSVYSNSSADGAGRDFAIGRPEVVAFVAPTDGDGPRAALSLERTGSSISAGGLTATYYSGAGDFGRPLYSAECSEAGQACHDSVDFSVSAADNKVRFGGAPGSRVGEVTLSLGNSEYAVRWAGFVQATTAGTYQFTAELLGFNDTSSSGDPERVRLWIDNRMVVDQWSSLSSGSIQGTFAMASAADAYPIKIFYKQSATNASSGLRLKWERQESNSNLSSAVVPSTSLFPLDGTMIATALVTVPGKYQMEISVAQGGGLFATYYSDSEMREPSSSGSTSVVSELWSSAALSAAPWLAAQWSGLLRFGGGAPAASDGTEVSLGVELRGADERVKVELDGEVVIEWTGTGPYQDTNPTPITGPNGGVTLTSATRLRVGQYYNLRISYWVGEQGRPLLRLWCSAGGTRSLCGIESTVDSSSLYMPFRTHPSQPFDVTVAPGSARASKSTMRLGGGSVATAGVQTDLIVIARDEFGNEVEPGAQRWLARSVNFPEWDALEPYAAPRTSRDCINCGRAQTDLLGGNSDDGSFSGSVVNTRIGTFKVLSDLLVPAGVQATYYDVLSNGTDGAPLFHRDGQRLDYSLDFPTPCVTRLCLDGWTSESRTCSGWVRGTIRSGNETSISFGGDGWVIDDFWSANASDWRVLVTSGKCEGQSRRVSGIQQSTGGTTVTLSAAWNQSSGTGSEGALLEDGAGLGTGWDGCDGPSAGGEFVLWHATRPPGSLPSSSFGVRWSGFITPSFSSPYTFSALISSESSNQERVKLWLDSRLVIDQWSSLASSTPSVASSLSSSSGYHHVQLRYKRGAASSTPPQIRFQWENSLSGAEASPVQVIPSSKLFGAATIPPESVAVSEVNIIPAATCGPSSIAFGTALTETTAGTTSYFTIRARDEYGNSRRLEEDAWSVVLHPQSGGEDVRGSVFSSQSSAGDYVVSYMTTQSGQYELDVQRPTPGGLLGTYFNNVHMHGETLLTHVSSQIDYDWGLGVVAEPGGCNVSVQHLWEGVSVDENACLMGSDFVSARWTGMFRAEVSEEYTFTLDGDEAASLTVEGDMKSWGCMAGNYMSCSTSGPGSIDVEFEAVAEQLYEITVVFKEFTGNASLRLSYASASVLSQIVPSSRLYYSPEHIFGSPFSVTVQAADVSPSESALTGLGISTATAGVVSSFTIVPRDEYHNPSTSHAGTFTAFVTNADPAIRSTAVTVTELVKLDQYKDTYTETLAGDAAVHVMLVGNRGVFATYYDSEQGGEPVKAREEEVISLDTAVGGQGVPASVGDFAFSVRWRGMLRPSASGEYSFYAVNVPANSSSVSERVRLWVDGQLLIDQRTSMALSSLSSGTISLETNPNYYEVVVDYMAPDPSSSLSLDYASAGGNRSTIPSSNLYLPQYLPHKEALPIEVKAAETDLQSTLITGVGLTVATAGLGTTFSIACFDAFGNSRATSNGDSGCSSELRVDALLQLGDGGGAVLNTTLEETGTGAIEVVYTPQQVGTHQTFVSVGSAVREYDVFVHPGAACAAPTRAAGHALTVATAGFTATFSIQAKDAFANLRCVGGDDFRVWIRGPGDEQHDAATVYMGVAPATNLGQYAVAYRPTRSGEYRLGVQLGTQMKGKVRMTCYIDSKLQIEKSVEDQAQINIDWGEDGCGDSGPLDAFGVRWEGWVEAPYSELYTFDVSFGGADERVRLWVEDTWVLDQWASLSASNPSCTLFLSAGALTDISMDYKDMQGSSKAILRWQSASQTRQIVPSTSLYGWSRGADLHIQGSPFALSVYPAMTSGTVTSAQGTALSLATAGLSAAFTIQARDHLGNRKTSGGDRFDVRARHNDDFAIADILGTVTELGDGEYRAVYVPTWKRRGKGGVDAEGSEEDFHEVIAQLAVPGGLMATYYNAPEFTSPSRTRRVSSVALAVPDAAAPLASACVDSASGFAVRFAGLIDPPGQQLYTFRTVLGGTEERVRVWVDNFLLIDQWSSLAGGGGAGTVPSGTFYIQERGDLAALEVEYRVVNASAAPNSSLDLQWEYQGAAAATVSGDGLLHGHQLSFMVGGNENGLAATYYSPAPSGDATLGGEDATLAVTDQGVDWSGSGSDVRPFPQSVPGAQSFAVRWVGFLRSSQPTWGVYTFQTRLLGGSSERLRLWVDNQQIIDQWSSVDSAAPSGSIRLPPGESLFNIRIEYKLADGTQADRGWRLEWKARESKSELPDVGEYDAQACQNGSGCSQATQRWTIGGDEEESFVVVGQTELAEARTGREIERDDFGEWDVDYYDPSQRWHQDRQAGTSGAWGKTGGCPSSAGPDGGGRYLWCRGQGLRSNGGLRVEVRAGGVCGSQVVASGAALTLATAGSAMQFRVTSRDAYQNQREGEDDAFLARAALAEPEQPETTGRAAFRGLGGESEGIYAGEYVVTVSGRYDLSVETLDLRGAGLFAAYFAGSVPFTGESDVRVDPRVDFEWGRESPTWRINRGGAFSVRWSGWIRAEVTALHRLYVRVDGPAQVFVEDAMIIDGSNLAFGDVFMERGVAYRFRMDYVHSTGIAYATLSWRPGNGAAIEVVPEDSLFPATQVIQNGVTALYANPSTAHAPAFTFSGQGLSLTTAGVASSFSITVRDEYSNIRDDPNDLLVARILPDGCSGPVPPGSLPEVLRHPPQDSTSEIGTVSSGSLADGVLKSAATTLDGSSSTFGWATGNVHPFSYRTTRAGASLLFTDLALRDSGAAATVREVQVVSGGSGYSSDTALNVTCFGSCAGAGLSGTCRVFNGTVVAVLLSDRGQGYTPAAPPTATCDGDATTTNATLSVLVGWESEFYAFGQGLMATYYDEVLGSSGTAWVNQNVDFSESGLRVPEGLQDDGEFRVRWEGFMRAPRGGGFTMHASLTQADERLKLWVDRALVVDQWHSLAALQVAGAEGAQLAVGAAPGQLVDLQVEYRKAGSAHVPLRDSGLTLKRSDDGGSIDAASTVELQDLFGASAPGLSPFVVDVRANIACSTQSEVYGPGLSLATAGEPAQFTIHLRDEYSNSRLVGGDEVVVRAFSDQCQTPPADEEAPFNLARCQPYPPQTGSDGADSRGRTTPGGGYLLRAGGAVVSAGDAAGCSLAGEGSVALSGGGVVGVSAVDGFYAGDMLVFAAGGCAGRWARVASYNGSTGCANLSVSGGLWSDGLAACTAASNHTVYAVNGDLVQATEIFAPMSCPNCQSSTRAVVSDRGDGTLLSSMVLTGRGQHSVFASTSPAQGLTATYYDAPARLTRDLGTGSPVAVGLDGGSADAFAVDWSSSSPGTAPASSLAGNASGFAVRWAGFVRPSRGGLYTFHVGMGGGATTATDRIKLWVDNQLVIGQWTSLLSAEPSGTVRIAESGQLYDVGILYKCPPGNVSCGYTLEWENTAPLAPCDRVQRDRIPPPRLRQRADIPNALGQLKVVAGVPCAAASFATASPLSIATAGVAASFTIQARDAYGNAAEIAVEYFVQLEGAGGLPIYSGASAPLQPSQGTSLGSYTAFVAKQYQLTVQGDTLEVSGSPFAVTVVPNVLCGSTSTLSGSGLTSATVSPATAQFSIEARDEYGNARGDAQADAGQFLVRVVRTEVEGVQGAAGLPPLYGASALADPGDIPTLYASVTSASGGVLSAAYTVPSIPSPAGQAHYLHAAWLVAGAVHATYYSSAESLSSALPAPCAGCDNAHKVTPNISTSPSSSAPADLDPALVGPSSLCGSSSCNLVIRWEGAVQACPPSTVCQGGPGYTRDFKWSMAASDRVKLWVDNELIIDQWTSLAAAAPSASASFGSYDRVLDFFAEYQRLASDTSSSDPVQLLDTGSDDGSFQVIDSARLYTAEALLNTPYRVNVLA